MYILWIFVWRKDEREPERTQDVTNHFSIHIYIQKHLADKKIIIPQLAINAITNKGFVYLRVTDIHNIDFEQ